MTEETKEHAIENTEKLNQMKSENETLLNKNKSEPKLEDKPPFEEGESKDGQEENASKENKKKAFLQFVIFALFSASAGIIQMLSFECLYHWIGWDNWWATYLISLTLSVIWNFTFNRKFTFKSSSNVPIAMTLVLLYYCAFTPISVFGGQALENAGWNGTLVTVIMMLLNFATEFFFDKYVTFNDKVITKLAEKFSKKKKDN